MKPKRHNTLVIEEIGIKPTIVSFDEYSGSQKKSFSSQLFKIIIGLVLICVAHLGGIGGMKRFVLTKGQYDPKDELGTSLSNYYAKFSA